MTARTAAPQAHSRRDPKEEDGAAMTTRHNEELWRRDPRRFQAPCRRRRRDDRSCSDPMRTFGIALLALLAALACVAFAPQAWGADAARAVPAMQATSLAPAGREAAAPRYALVIQDTVPLRAAPRATGAPLAQLGQGELLELRGERMDYLQVYDTRRERGGYVRASALRPLTLDATEAPELLALLRFLRDRPGTEPLGLGVAAAYLKAAPAGSITAEPFDMMGLMAERLAWRANAAGAQAGGATKRAELAIAAQLEIAAGLGVHFDGIERDGGVVLCYDGEAFRHVLALAPTPRQAARAALALTRPDCIDPALPPLARWQRDRADAALLERIDVTGLAPYERNRIRMRRAATWAALAYEDSRRLAVEAGAGPGGLPAVGPAEVQRAGENALVALAGVDKSELTDDDLPVYAEAAMRVGASRWAAEPGPVARAPSSLGVLLEAGQPGETCVLLVDAKHGAASPLLRRCTFGTVWAASARANAAQTTLALAVQPLATWRELWVFRKAAEGWTVQVLPPAPDAVGLGYVEFAGWVPGTGQVLAAREVRDAARAGQAARSFELLDADTLATLRRAETPGALSSFLRWQDPQWKRVTVSLR